MTAKELRELLANVPDTTEVVVEDVAGKGLSISVDESIYLRPLVYLRVNKEFPECWYNEAGEEINF